VKVWQIVRGTSCRDGVIEVDLSGDTAPDAPPQLRGFVGIAFHVTDRSHFELLDIQPRNGRPEDQLQRNHSTQYMSMPGFPWDKLRSETPANTSPMSTSSPDSGQNPKSR
jgi:hypothetical protein